MYQDKPKANYKKILLLISGLALIVFITIILIPKSTGTLILDISPGSAQIDINDKIYTEKNIKLEPGIYKITVSSEGYISQDKSITITKNNELKLAVNLLKNTPENTALDYIKNNIYKDYPDFDFTIIGTEMFYDNSWGLVKLNGREDPIFVILKKDNLSSNYTVLLTGPPFNYDSISELPPDIQASLREGLAE